MWVVFTSIFRAGNGLTAELFVYCNGALMGCCEEKNKTEGLKNIREFLDQVTDYRFTCGQKVSMGKRVGYLQSTASSPPQLIFKTQSVFAIKTLCVYFYKNIIEIFS
jgi:hypothetical protein